MKHIILLLIFVIAISSCKSSKSATKRHTPQTEIVSATKTKNTKNSRKKKKNVSKSKADYIIDYATQFEGVRYKWGGTTKSGMDCSGLVYESFKTYEITLPRISRDMAKKGNKIQLKKVHKGDLLFFKTGKNRRGSINHVGLIVDIRDNDIKFIHATTGKGVIISGLNEAYWLKAFHEARRIL